MSEVHSSDGATVRSSSEIGGVPMVRISPPADGARARTATPRAQCSSVPTTTGGGAHELR